MKKKYKLKFVRKKRPMNFLNNYADKDYIAIGRKRKRAKEFVFDQKQGGSKKSGTASLLSYMMKYAGDDTVNIRDRIDEIVSKNNLGVSPHTKEIVENLMQMAKYTKKFKVSRVGDFTIKAGVDFADENTKLRSGELYAEAILSSTFIKHISSAHYTSSKPLLNPEDTSFLVWEIIDGYPEFEVTDLYVASLSELDLLTKDNITTKDAKPGFLTVTAKMGDKIGLEGLIKKSLRTEKDTGKIIQSIKAIRKSKNALEGGVKEGKANKGCYYIDQKYKFPSSSVSFTGTEIKDVGASLIYRVDLDLERYITADKWGTLPRNAIYMPEIRKVLLACEIYALFYPDTQGGKEIKAWMDRYAETITSSQFLPVFEKAYVLLKKVFKGFVDTFYNRVRYDTMNSNKRKLEIAYDFIGALSNKGNALANQESVLLFAAFKPIHQFINSVADFIPLGKSMLFVYKAILGVLVYTSEDLEKQIRASLYAIWNISACGKNSMFDFSFSATPLFYGIAGKFSEEALKNVLGNLSAEVNRHASSASNFSDPAVQNQINSLRANLKSKDQEIQLLKNQNSKYQKKNMIQEERNLDQSINELQVQLDQSQNVISPWSKLFVYPQRYKAHIEAAENLALQAGNESAKLALGEYEGHPCPVIAYGDKLLLINYKSPGEYEKIKSIGNGLRENNPGYLNAIGNWANDYITIKIQEDSNAVKQDIVIPISIP